MKLWSDSFKDGATIPAFSIFNASINRIMWNATAMQISRWGDVAHLTHIALDEVDK